MMPELGLRTHDLPFKILLRQEYHIILKVYRHILLSAHLSIFLHLKTRKLNVNLERNLKTEKNR